MLKQTIIYFSALIVMLVFCDYSNAQWTYAFMDQKSPAGITRTEFRHGVDIGFAMLSDALQENFRRVAYNQRPTIGIWINDFDGSTINTAFHRNGNIYFGFAIGYRSGAELTIERRVQTARTLLHEMVSHAMTGVGNQAHRWDFNNNRPFNEYRSSIKGVTSEDYSIAQDDRAWLASFGWHPKSTFNEWHPIKLVTNRKPVINHSGPLEVERGSSSALDFQRDNFDRDRDKLIGQVYWVRHGAAVIQGDGKLRYWARASNNRPLPTRFTTDTIVVSILEEGNPFNDILLTDKKQWEVIEVEIKN